MNNPKLVLILEKLFNLEQQITKATTECNDPEYITRLKQECTELCFEAHQIRHPG